MYEWTNVCMHLCLDLCIHMSACMYVCMYLWIHCIISNLSICKAHLPFCNRASRSHLSHPSPFFSLLTSHPLSPVYTPFATFSSHSFRNSPSLLFSPSGDGDDNNNISHDAAFDEWRADNSTRDEICRRELQTRFAGERLSVASIIWHRMDWL